MQILASISSDFSGLFFRNLFLGFFVLDFVFFFVKLAKSLVWSSNEDDSTLNAKTENDENQEARANEFWTPMRRVFFAAEIKSDSEKRRARASLFLS